MCLSARRNIRFKQTDPLRATLVQSRGRLSKGVQYKLGEYRSFRARPCERAERTFFDPGPDQRYVTNTNSPFGQAELLFISSDVTTAYLKVMHVH